MSMSLEETPFEVVDLDGGSEDDPNGYWAMDAPHGRFANGKPRKTPAKGGGGKSSGKGIEKLTADVANAIAMECAPPLAAFSPLAGYVLDQRADRTAKALGRIAARSPRFKAGLELFVESTDYIALAVLPLSLAVAVAVDYSFMNKDSQIASKLLTFRQEDGTTENAYEVCYGDDGSERIPGAGMQPQYRGGLITEVG